MPTPSGTISLSDVNIELRRTSTASINMNEADVRSLARIPSGTISMSDLRSKSIVVGVGVDSFADNSGANAKAGVWWGSGGAFQTIQNDVFTNQQPGLNIWSFKSIAGLGADYQLNVSQTGGSGGTFTSDFSLNTWVSMSTDRRMDLQTTGIGFISRTFSVSIRESATSTVVATGSITLSAERV